MRRLLAYLWGLLMALRLRIRGASAAATPVTDITLSANSIAENAAQGTVVGTLSNNLGISVSWEITDNSDFQLSASTGTTVTLQRSGTGTLTEGVNESVTIRATAPGASAYDENFSISVGAAESATFLFDMEFRNDGGSTASSQILTRTVAFASGEVPDGQLLEVRKSDGTTALAYQQVDLVAEHDDGSMRFAVITVEQEDNCNAAATQTLKLYRSATSTASNTSSITDQNLKDLDYTIEVDITSVGTVEFDVAACITASRVRNTKIGPVLREVRVFHKVRDGLFVVAWIGLRRDGTTAYAYGRCISHWNELYTSSASAPGTGTITALRILKGGSNAVAYSSLSYNMKGGAAQDVASSTFEAVYSSNAPTMIPIYDLDQLVAANAVIPLKVRAGVVSAIGTPTPDTLVPFDPYDIDTNLDHTGGSPDIGWMSGWSARALLSQNKGTYQQLRANFNGTNLITKNHYNSTSGEVVIARDETYGSITGDKDVGASVGNNVINRTAGSSPFGDVCNMYHWPQLPWVTYLIHGMSWHLESVVIDGCHGVLASGTPHSMTWNNADSQLSVMRSDGGPRGYAWAEASASNAHFCVPTAHPVRGYVDDIMADCVAFCNSMMKTGNVATQALTLGLPIGNDHDPGGGVWYPSFIEGVIDGTSWSTRWFQWHYWMVVVGMDILRGNFAADDEFVAAGAVKAYVTVCNACPSRAQPYTMNFSEQNVSTGALTDIAENVNDIAIADSTGTWDDTTKLVPSTGCPVSGVYGTFLGMHNYPWYGTAAAIMLERAGVSGASTLAAYMVAERDGATLASDSLKAENPQFDLERAA